MKPPIILDNYQLLPGQYAIPLAFKFLEYDNSMKKMLNNTIDFLVNLQLGDGGFRKTQLDNRSETWVTGQVLALLYQLNAISRIDQDACRAWLKERILSDGGFEWIEDIGKSSLENTLYGMIGLLILGESSPHIEQNVIDYTIKLQMAGGFRSQPEDSEPDIRSTYNAVLLFRILNRIEDLEKDAILAYLKTCQTSTGGFERYHGQGDVSTYTTGNAIIIADILGGLHQIQLKSAINFLENYQLSSGGFPYRLEEKELQLWSTAHSIHGLIIANHLEKIDTKQLVELFLNMQKENGGFIFRPDQDMTHTNISPTFISVVVLLQLLKGHIVELPKYISSIPFKILEILQNQKSISILEIVKILNSNPYEVRRGINVLISKKWVSGSLREDIFYPESIRSFADVKKTYQTLEKTLLDHLISIKSLEHEITELKTRTMTDKQLDASKSEATILQTRTLEEKIQNLEIVLKDTREQIMNITWFSEDQKKIDEWIQKRENMFETLESIRFTTLWRQTRETN